MSDGPPLMFVRGWIGHLELHWSDSAFRSYFEALACQHHLIRYDVRGNGLSQRRVHEIDLERLVVDLEAVMEELALSDVTLCGATVGGPIAVTYAARHPERVGKLILDGTYARGRELASPERQDAIIRMIRHFPDMAYQRLLTSLTHPEPEQASFRRASPQEVCSPDVAAQLYTLCYQIDVSALLPEIRVLTLVLHRRGSRAISFQQGRELASLLPNARFVSLEGTAHNSWEGDAAAALAAIGDLLGVRLERAPTAASAASQSPLTILFTDMESSTALTNASATPKPGSSSDPPRHRPRRAEGPRRLRDQAHRRRHHGLVPLGLWSPGVCRYHPARGGGEGAPGGARGSAAARLSA